MSEKAFPRTPGGDGMTLRDYFAAKAMQVLLDTPSLTSYEEVAEHAYLVADAMLKEREK